MVYQLINKYIGNKRTHKEMVTVDEYEGDEHPS